MTVQIIHGEGIPDDFPVTGKEQLRPFLEHVGDHHQDDIILLLFPDLFQNLNEIGAAGEEMLRIDGGDLRDRKGVGM